MKLGISPLITSNMAIQYLAGTKVLTLDRKSKEDRRKLEGLQKIVGFSMTLAIALAYVLSGMYGSLSVLGTGNAILIILQLFASGVVITLLDEMMSKGYGIGSGMNLFMAANICETIVWKAFSPTALTTERGKEYEGAVIAFFHLLVVRSNKITAVWEAFTRSHLPNLSQLMATAVIFCVVIYFQVRVFHLMSLLFGRKHLYPPLLPCCLRESSLGCLMFTNFTSFSSVFRAGALLCQ